MKKIFRMALVFALAGATLMYTSCTKDYQEEINKLDGQISNLESSLNGKLADLQSELSNVKSSVSSLETAYKAADKALGDKIDGVAGDVSSLKTKVAAIETAIKDLDKLATKKELSDAKANLEKKITDDLAALKAEILEKTDDLAKQLADLKEELEKKADAEDVEIRLKALEEAQASIDEVYGFLSDELRSIVFLPDFYFGGVEATSYDFASFWGTEPVALKEAYPMTVTIKTDEESEAPAGSKASSGELKIVFPKGAKTTASDMVSRDDKGKIIMYAVDPLTYDYLYGADGKPVVWNKSLKNAYGMSYLQYPWFYANESVGQIGIAYYDLNPSSFPTDSAEWRLRGMNREYVVKSTDDAMFWAPVFEGIEKDGDHAAVKYSIENPEWVFSSIIGPFGYMYLNGIYHMEEDEDALAEWVRLRRLKSKILEAAIYAGDIADPNANLPVMQLIADLDENRDVRSDWAAISHDEELIDHLAFSASNKWVTENEDDCEVVKDWQGNTVVKDLYYTAYDAVEPDASVQVKYNGGPVDLAELISIHTISTRDGEPSAVYTLSQFNKKYPGYSYKFELVPYTQGGFDTSEEMYGDIEGTMFTPCWVETVDKKPVSHKIEKDAEVGISSCGRMPIVLAQLVNDETGYSYAVGYFKILIARDPKEATETWLDIPDLGKVPYICGPFTLSTTWHEFSSNVLEKLKVDYDEFFNDYKLTGIYGYEKVKKDNGQIVTELTLIKEASADQEVELTYDEPQNNGKTKTKNYGTASYTQDKSGTGINDAFSWTVNPKDIGEGKAKSIYFKFEKGKYDIVYVEMKADVASHATFDFGKNKIANEWYDYVDGEVKNTAHVNVLVPNATTDDVTDFYRDLNHFFVNYKPSVVLTSESDPVYENYFDEDADDAKKAKYDPAELAGKYEFYFASEQPEIVFSDKDGKPIKLNDELLVADDEDAETIQLSKIQLYVNDWDGGTSDTLYVPQFQKNEDGEIEMVTETKKVGGKDKDVPVLDEARVVATLEKTGKVTYYYDEGDIWSKKLLNLWSYTQTNQARMLYTNVLVKTFYGECDIPAGDAKFHLRFVRPLDVNFQSVEVAEESAVAGFDVLLAKFISGIIDWNKQKVIVPEKDKSGKATGYYVANVIKGVDMYEYYKFKTITLDFENAERDNWDADDMTKRGKLMGEGGVTPDAQLSLAQLDDKGVPTLLDSNVLPISKITDIKNISINYRNDRAPVENFNIFIPVAIEYAWGTITETLEIKVKATSGTTPK